MKQLLKIVVGVILVAFGSCESPETITPADRPADYIPLRQGRYQIYDVKGISYTLGKAQSFAYELKTVVADSFKNTQGGYTHVIHRSTRISPTGEWKSLDTWSVRINDKEAVVQEENIPYVVLRFPLEKGTRWNGNLYNVQLNPSTQEREDWYEFESVGEGCDINDVNFENCAVVVQEDNEEFIVLYDRRKEIYARGTGLVYKEFKQLRYCTDENCIGQQRVNEGIEYIQSIKEYGQE